MPEAWARPWATPAELVVRNTFLETGAPSEDKSEALRRQAYSERDATRRKEVAEARAALGDEGGAARRRRKNRLAPLEDPADTPPMYSTMSSGGHSATTPLYPATPDTFGQQPLPPGLADLNAASAAAGNGYDWGYWQPGNYWLPAMQYP